MRGIISRILAVAIVLGLASLPQTVLCVGTGGHFAIELIGGEHCSVTGSGYAGISSQWKDGCPKGCTDAVLSAEVRSTHPGSLTAGIVGGLVSMRSPTMGSFPAPSFLHGGSTLPPVSSSLSRTGTILLC